MNGGDGVSIEPAIPVVNMQELTSPLAGLALPVQLHVFTADQCEPCLRLEHFAEELSAASPLLQVRRRLSLASALATEFQIDKHPAVLIHGRRPYRLVYAGVPAGYELAPFVNLLRDAATGEPQVQPATRDRIEQLPRAVQVRIFVTPACTYCPTMTRNAGKLAILSRRVAVEVIDAFEFPTLAETSGVRAVPYTQLNDRLTLNEAVGEAQLVYAVTEAAR